MPPPKRPFTTSSLTSTLKSTFANQPLLNNLTNIDKLSSQASSLAQKTPFFGAINQQFQQHYQQQEGGHPQQDADAGTGRATQNQANVTKLGTNLTGSGSGSGSNLQSSASTSRVDEEMFRDVQASSSGSGHRAPQQPAASTPAVDMSHLTEEERAMIQSVMAKAEMADMGLPVDTSMPSSTNLPSNTSQALTQQRDQQQKQQQLQQHQKQQLQNNSHNSASPSQQMQQQSQSRHQQPDISNYAQTSQSLQANHNAMNLMQQQQQQQQHQQQHQKVDQPRQNEIANHFDASSQQIRLNQAGMNMMYEPNQLLNNANRQQDVMQNLTFDSSQQGQLLDTAPKNLQSLEQQPARQLFNQMDSSFNQPLNGNQQCEQSNQNMNLNLQQQQQQQVPVSNYANQGLQDQMIGNMLSSNNSQVGSANNVQLLYDVPAQQQQYNYQGSFDQNQMQIPAQLQSQSLAQPQTIQNTVQVSNFDQIQQLSGPTNLQQTGVFESGTLAQNSPNYMNAATSNLNQQLVQNDLAASMQLGDNRYQQNPITFSQPNVLIQPSNTNSTVKPPYVRPRSNLEAISDFEYEHAYSDLDEQRAGITKRNLRSNQPMSRHESVDTNERRATRRSRIARDARDTRDTRDLQAYDLASKRPVPSGGNHHQKSRRLPQPGCSNQGKQPSTDRSLQSSSEYLLDERPKSRESVASRKKLVVSPDSNQQQATRSKSATRRNTRSRKYQTESDLEDDTLSATDSNEQVSKLAEDTSVKKTSSVEESSSKPETLDSDKNEQALKLLKELKLTEQANQVMEQQQLLIKQSQELIKLQQAQLEQQAEIKKVLNNGEKSRASKDGDQSDFDRDSEASKAKELILDRQSGEETSSTVRSVFDDAKTTGDNEKQTNPDKKKSVANESKLTKSISRDESESRLHNGGLANATNKETKKANRETLIEADNQSRRAEKNESKKSRHSAPITAVSKLTQASRRDRDLFQSPTDTTDSDIDLVSQSSSRLRHPKQSSAKTVTAPRMRREPRGLPPSPLPVAAAIQLHQMQQKHKNQMTASNSTRANYLRSRSVTSSPNHMLDRYNSGYTTDDQRRRPTSPDTMSEYGGLRRRKRLPEPPANVVPITPSMVRRMVQANRAAAAVAALSSSSSGAYQERFSGVNTENRLHSYPTNSSTSYLRNPSYGKPSNLTNDFRQTTDGYIGSSILSEKRSSSFEPSSILGPHSTSRVRGYDLAATNKLANTDMISKGTSSLDFCNSIMRGSDIIDIKETPELDKLISNLDAYYNLDGSTGVGSSPLTYSNATKSAITSTEPKLDDLLMSSSAYPHSSRPTMTSYGSQRAFQAQQYPKLTHYTGDPSYNSPSRHRSELNSYVPYSGQSSAPRLHDHRQTMASSLPTTSYYGGGVGDVSSVPSTTMHYNPSSQTLRSYDDSLATTRHPGLAKANYNWQSIDRSSGIRDPYLTNVNSPTHIAPFRRTSYDAITNDPNFYTLAPSNDSRLPSAPSYNRTSYVSNNQYKRDLDYDNSRRLTSNDGRYLHDHHQSTNSHGGATNNLAPLTKDDIINNGPKFDSIGYRFRTESQNKYVTEQRPSIECLQSKYLYPYKRILLSKNPKDRIGNGIGVRIIGGQPLPNVYDKVNKCIVTSGAFVTEVFQSSRVYFMDEMHEGDQIIEWNGVNLCNRSDEEVQQILFSQFSDEEVEIIYLNRDKFFEAYGGDHDRAALFGVNAQHNLYEINDTFDAFSRFNKSTSSKKSRPLGRGSFFMGSR